MSQSPGLIDAARAGEPERYLAALLAPAQAREALLAIAAFAAELRRIPAAVSDPMIGEIRLQWWRDALATATASGHPVADAVVAAIDRHRLPPALFLAAIEARSFDIYPDPMPDEAAFDGYLGKTEGVLFELAYRALADVAPGPETIAALSAAGRAYGMTRLVADLPHWLVRGRMPLPAARIAEATASDVRPSITWLLAMCSDIQAARTAALRHMVNLSRVERVAVLPLAVVGAYIRSIIATSRDPLREPAEIAPMSRILHIAAAHWLKRY